MTLADLAAAGALTGGAAGGVCFRTGPFITRLETRFAPVLSLLVRFYGETEAFTTPQIVNFNIALHRPLGPRRWWRAQMRFRIEDTEPFEPYPLSHSYPLFEWGLNWSIATRSNHYLMLHAGVVERAGRALILPAVPGSGKSTLSTALAFRGWRLLSDEFGLIERPSGRVMPLPRAIPLKNRSIDVIRAYLPEAELGPRFDKTRKGTVCHVRPPDDCIRRQQETAEPAWIVFPRYVEGHPTDLIPIPKSLAFVRLAHNSFNYRVLGATGFEQLRALIGRCDCYSLTYSEFDSVLPALAAMADGGRQQGP
jgi:HprK-related kinase A